MGTTVPKNCSIKMDGGTYGIHDSSTGKAAVIKTLNRSKARKTNAEGHGTAGPGEQKTKHGHRERKSHARVKKFSCLT
jgi:hypothetical protein